MSIATQPPTTASTAVRTARVVIADDQTLFRSGLARLLDGDDRVTVVGEAVDGLDAVKIALATKPDVVLMDIKMPGTDGLEATRRISAEPDLGGVRVIILTTFEEDEYIFAAIQAGASGFLV